MIYTLTFSPAIDLSLKIDNINLGEINTMNDYSIKAGGKGINVSFALNKLNLKSNALGFIGGATGKFIKDELDKNNISNYLIDTGITTRINLKIISDKETEINGESHKISDDNILKLKNYLSKLNVGDILVISGSANIDNLTQILDFIDNKGIKLIIDTKRFIDVLKYKPFLIKPNKIELEEALNRKLNNEIDILNALKKLNELGAKNILLSLGSCGAYFYNGNLYKSEAIKLKSIISTVGAGDTMLRAFIYDYLNNNDFKHALDFSVLAGTAKVKLGYFPNIEEVMGLKKEE